MERPYHPALARLAAQHDEVIGEMRAGRLTPSEARRRVLLLVARDDTGLEWSIDPDTGFWRFRDRSGVFSYADPPSLGNRGTEPADVGSEGRRAGWDRVHLHEVPDGIRPRQLPFPDASARERKGASLRFYVVLALGVLTASAAALFLL